MINQKLIASSAHKLHFIRSWWVYLFCCCCACFYLHASKKKSGQLEALDARLEQLAQQKAAAVLVREEQLLQIQSQKDPRWIEMVLMRKLGLVPDNTLKVYFQRDIPK